MTARRFGALALILVTGLLARAEARQPRSPAQRQVRETDKTRVVVKTQQVTMPAEAWEGRRVQVQESARTLVRQIYSDAAPQNGSFVRTIRTTTVTSKTPGEAGWARRPEEFTPRWAKKDAPYLYTSKRLGTLYGRDSVQVRLFAPEAREVYLVIEGRERIRLAPDRSGVWEGKLARAPRDLYGKAYHFEVDGKSVSSPYSHLTRSDYGPSVFAELPDLEVARGKKGSVLKQLQARGISEVHVKDMTAHASSPVRNPAERGTYLGLKAPGVLDHYDDFGVGGLELLPVSQFDVQSGDTRNGQPTKNHWGYMTTHYPAAHQGWAARPDRAHHELREAIQGLRGRGKAVVLDIAFNHTAKGPSLHLMVLGKHYYYRLRPDGGLADGAGCGNELATEKPMVRKMVVQTLRDFVNKFGVDGFRLDLGSLLDKQTIRAIDRALPKRVFLTAEPWAADWTRARWGKGDLQDTRMTVWNDDFRNAAWSFLGASGSIDTRNSLMNAVCGSVKSYGKGFARRPSQSVNYMDSHDELSLADRVEGNKQRAFLGQVLLLTSQGIPMMGHGQEFMRTKQGIANAHNLDNDVSWINWGLRRENGDFFDATKKLLALRASSPHFQYDRPLTDKDISWITPGNSNALGYLVKPPAGTKGRKAMPDYLVLLNSDKREEVSFNLPRAGDWKVIADGATLQVNATGLRMAAGTYRVAPGTAVILSQARPPVLPEARAERE